MFWLILGIVVLIVGICFSIWMACEGEGAVSIIPSVIAFVLAAVIIGASCIASLPTGHTGILTTFGRVEDVNLEAGVHLKAPWQKIVKMDNRVQKTNITLSCFSSDIQEVTISYTVNYQIDKTNAQTIYRTIGTNYADTVIMPNISESVKLVVAKFTAEELVSSRAEMAKGVETALTEALASYNIQVVSTAVEDMGFTDTFTNAVEAKQVAAQNKLQAEIQQNQKIMEQEAAAQIAKIKAEADAEVARVNAQAALEVTKIEADAAEYAGQKEAAANKAIAESLTPELVNYYYIQNWNGTLPSTYVGSDNVSTILNGTGD